MFNKDSLGIPIGYGIIKIKSLPYPDIVSLKRAVACATGERAIENSVQSSKVGDKCLFIFTDKVGSLEFSTAANKGG